MKQTHPHNRTSGPDSAGKAGRGGASMGARRPYAGGTAQRFKAGKPGKAAESGKGNNLTGMPDKLKSGLEKLSGMDLGDVRVHRNSNKPAHLKAHAYAKGNEIHLGPGQDKHLPHEAWHVVQQRQGRVKATTQMKAGGKQVPVNDNKQLEKEADVMGAKAMQMKAMEPAKGAVSQLQAKHHAKGCGCGSCGG